MLKISPQNLAGRSLIFRYAFFLITGVRFQRYRSWKAAGEPNPFVAKTYRHRRTERIEFVDIFEDVLDVTRSSRSPV